MHIFKLASFSTIVGLAIANSAFATTGPTDPESPVPNIPTVCPSVLEILKLKGDSKSECKTDKLHTNSKCTYSIADHRFATDNMWHFFMHLDAEDADAASMKAEDALATLAYASGPTKETDNLYFCKYTNGFNYEAIAAWSPNGALLNYLD